MIAMFLLAALASAAQASRKRVAVLPFQGPSATTQIRGELVRVVQKAHTVISLDSWTRTARTLSATKVSKSNVRKVARRLEVDAVIDATVIQRRNGFRVRLRLRDGATGEMLDELNLITIGTRFDKASLRDLRDELIDVISTLGDHDDRRPTRKQRNG